MKSFIQFSSNSVVVSALLCIGSIQFNTVRFNIVVQYLFAILVFERG